MNIFKQVVQDESGQNLVEYALIAFLVGCAAITSMRGYASSVSATWTYLCGVLRNATS